VLNRLSIFIGFLVGGYKCSEYFSCNNFLSLYLHRSPLCVHSLHSCFQNEPTSPEDRASVESAMATADALAQEASSAQAESDAAAAVLAKAQVKKGRGVGGWVGCIVPLCLDTPLFHSSFPALC